MVMFTPGGSRGGGGGGIYRNDPRSGDGSPIVAGQQLTLGRIAFTRSDDNSEVMSVDGKASGSPVNLWNGTGVDDTGSDWTASGEGSETTASKKEGTNGWDTGATTTTNDETVFDNESMIDVNGTYDELEFWMQPKAYPTGSKFRIRFVDSSDNLVGNNVLVDNYVSNMDLDVWQKVSIPISDFNLDGNVQKLQFRYRNAVGQHFWFDDIEVTASSGGGPYKFTIEAPDANTLYHVSMATVLLMAPTSGWNSDAFGNIASGLDKGLLLRHRRKSTSEVLWRFNCRNNLQLFGQYHPQEAFAFADNEQLVGFMVKPGTASVIITDDDVLEYVVRDDLSSVTEIRAFCHYGTEVIGA